MYENWKVALIKSLALYVGLKYIFVFHIYRFYDLIKGCSSKTYKKLQLRNTCTFKVVTTSLLLLRIFIWLILLPFVLFHSHVSFYFAHGPWTLIQNTFRDLPFLSSSCISFLLLLPSPVRPNPMVLLVQTFQLSLIFASYISASIKNVLEEQLVTLIHFSCIIATLAKFLQTLTCQLSKL